MRQAKVPVDDDGVEPQVCVIEVSKDKVNILARFHRQGLD